MDIVPHDLSQYIVMSRPHIGGIQVVLRFPNGLGVSMIVGPLISLDADYPIELGVVKFDGDAFVLFDVDNEVYQHINKAEAYQIIYRVMQQKPLIPQLEDHT